MTELKLPKLTRRKKIYYFFYRLFNKISPMNISREVKYFIQRGKRGYSDRDTWSIDAHLIEILPPMLRRVANHGVGFHFLDDAEADYTKEMTDEEWEKHAERWKQALLKAADDIEAHDKHENKDFPKTKKAQQKYFDDSKKAYEQTQRGMHWVADNFGRLWD